LKLVIFGLTVSSSWGNGHATLWRGLWKALARLNHRIEFFEHDVPYYAQHRDLTGLPGGQLVLYPEWEQVRNDAAKHLADADVAMVTSYCPDGPDAARLVRDSAARLKVYYDLDTPVTLDRLSSGRSVPYLPEQGLGDFDLVLSYTGGRALELLRTQLGARRVLPLYGHVDPEAHRPSPPQNNFRGDLSYLGTYAPDRQRALENLLIEPARRLPDRWFVIGGALYPVDFPWTRNIRFVRHLPPGMHPAFYCSSPLTLNVTREPMAAMGYCPSGRLFEAAACGTPVLSDWWEGLDKFYTPGEEILIARNTDQALDALQLTERELARIAGAARERTLSEHTSGHRARELECAFA
jgi:spore maturation protein CgeB